MNDFMEMTNELQPIFSRANQNISVVIEQVLREYKVTDFDLYDMFYCTCIFLGILSLKLPREKSHKFANKISQMLASAANKGLLFCNQIIAVSKTEKNSKETLKTLLSSLGNDGTSKHNLINEISNDINILAMKESGLWKLNETFLQNSHQSEKLEQALTQKFNYFIDDCLLNLSSHSFNHEYTVEIFLVTAIADFGLMAGYGAGIFKQSVETFMHNGINKFLSIHNKKEYLH